VRWCRYGDGATAEEAEAMRGERKALLEERARLEREVERYKDLADVTSGQVGVGVDDWFRGAFCVAELSTCMMVREQVEALNMLRKDRESELEELRKHCAGQ
jgi:hypothetical protein